MPSTLQGSVEPLVHAHDVALLDLDGVVYVGPDAVPGAPAALKQAREQGLRLAFVTNNAARPPEAVADHLRELGISARTSEIVTSAQAAARYLAERLPGGARVLVVGTAGLIVALRERGLVPVSTADGPVDAVVQGYSPDLDWKQLAEGAIAINRHVPWVATNLDPTVPSPRGPLPGNGSLVAALRTATRTEPVATGKPDPTMHREMVLRSKAERPIVVGDRLDTDIEGANAVGCPSLLVFTGVTSVADLLAAAPPLRPTYIAADVAGLLATHPEVGHDGDAWRCGRWQARVDGERRLILDARSSPVGDDTDTDPSDGAALDEDALDAVRVLCVARWSVLDDDDAVGDAADGAADDRAVHGARAASDQFGVLAATDDPAATAMLGRLGLASDSRGGGLEDRS